MKNRKYKQKKLSIKIKIIIIIAILSIIAVLLDRQMRPLVKSVIFNQAQTVSINVINQVVIDELTRLDIDYSDIVDIQKDDTGKILAVSTDMKKVNSLKSLMTLSIQKGLSTIDAKKTQVPLGNFTGTEILNGRGPKIPIDVSMSGSTIVDFKSEFVSAGINQTKHRLYLDISSEVLAFIPGYPVNTVARTSVLIAETIIVGEVPAVFAESTN